MYKFWMYYLGSPNNVGQDPPLVGTIYSQGPLEDLSTQVVFVEFEVYLNLKITSVLYKEVTNPIVKKP